MDFAMRLEYSAPKFYRISVKDRFVEFCKFCRHPRLVSRTHLAKFR